MSSGKAWWGFDVDKTIAVDEGGTRGGVIGAPIKSLIRRMKHYIKTGRRVAIVSARVHPSEPDMVEQLETISNFLIQVLGEEMAQKVSIRSDKDRHMIALYDDRAEQVIPNKGILVREELRRAVQALIDISKGLDSWPAMEAQRALDSLDPWSRALVRTAK